MKKKFSLFFVVVLMMMLVACDKSSNSGATSHNNSNSSSKTEVTPTVTSEPTSTPTPTLSPTPTLTPTPTPTPDPLAMLEVSEDWAKSCTGIYLKRGDKLYSLTNLPMSKAIEYNIGTKALDFKNVAKLAIEVPSYDTKKTKYLSAGDIPIVTLEEGDELRGYGQAKIACSHVESYNYSIRAEKGKGGSIEVYLYDTVDLEPLMFGWGGKAIGDDFEVCDDNGNVVEDFNNLNYGESYVASWYEGTDYHELQVVADCKLYTVETIGGSYSLPTEKTKDGYVLYNTSELPIGVYRVNNAGAKLDGGFIEIK